MKKRQVEIPGMAVASRVVMVDTARNGVYRVDHGGEVVMFFVAQTRVTARVMSPEEADAFTESVANTYRALKDDAEIAKMEEGLNGSAE